MAIGGQQRLLTGFFYNLSEHGKGIRTVFYIGGYGLTLEGVVAVVAEVIAVAGEESPSNSPEGESHQCEFNKLSVYCLHNV